VSAEDRAGAGKPTAETQASAMSPPRSLEDFMA